MDQNLNGYDGVRIDSRSGFQNRRLVLLTSGLAGAAWVFLIATIFAYNAGDYNFWFPGRVLTYVLLVIAPTLTFVPIGKALRLTGYGYWAVISWLVFGYTLAFVPSDPSLGWSENAGPLAVLLGSLFMVTVSVFLPIFYRLGFRLFSRKVEQYDIGRAWREAILVGLWLLLSAFLRAVGALSWISALALLGVFVILELIILSRNFGRR